MNSNKESILKAYLRLREKLIRIRDPKEFSEEKIGITSKEDILKSISSNHHYIPKFFNDGFLDDDGLLFVYDKKKRSY